MYVLSENNNNNDNNNNNNKNFPCFFSSSCCMGKHIIYLQEAAEALLEEAADIDESADIEDSQPTFQVSLLIFVH